MQSVLLPWQVVAVGATSPPAAARNICYQPLVEKLAAGIATAAGAEQLLSS